jgi:hypothetical protein
LFENFFKGTFDFHNKEQVVAYEATSENILDVLDVSRGFDDGKHWFDSVAQIVHHEVFGICCDLLLHFFFLFEVSVHDEVDQLTLIEVRPDEAHTPNFLPCVHLFLVFFVFIQGFEEVWSDGYLFYVQIKSSDLY